MAAAFAGLDVAEPIEDIYRYQLAQNELAKFRFFLLYASFFFMCAVGRHAELMRVRCGNSSQKNNTGNRSDHMTSTSEVNRTDLVINLCLLLDLLEETHELP